MAKAIKTKAGIGPVGQVLVGLAGTIASVVVTMYVKKLLEAKGLPERTEDLKVALKNAGASASDLKATALSWITQKAQTAAVSAADSAHAAADQVEAVAAQVKDKANG